MIVNIIYDLESTYLLQYKHLFSLLKAKLSWKELLTANTCSRTVQNQLNFTNNE